MHLKEKLNRYLQTHWTFELTSRGIGMTVASQNLRVDMQLYKNNGKSSEATDVTVFIALVPSQLSVKTKTRGGQRPVYRQMIHYTT